jgi:hypothetical protein
MRRRSGKQKERLIISEIKLYSDEQIDEAQRRKEILDLLKADLTQEKQHYFGRLAAGAPSNPDYFM